jgi:hypothetical protein
MTQILVDQELRERLLQTTAAELVDETGRILGSFVRSGPVSYPPGVVPPISEEERQQLLAAPGIYTTEQVLEHLRSL